MSDLQALRWHLARAPIRFEQRRLRHQLRQGTDAVARLARCDAFKDLSHGKEEHDQRRLLGRPDHQRARRGDGHQHLDREGHADPRHG